MTTLTSRCPGAQTRKLVPSPIISAPIARRLVVIAANERASYVRTTVAPAAGRLDRRRLGGIWFGTRRRAAGGPAAEPAALRLSALRRYDPRREPPPPLRSLAHR